MLPTTPRALTEAGQILCAGMSVAVPGVKVETFRAFPELGFPKLKIRPQTRAVMLHYTAGTGSREQVHRTLVERDVSVHLLVEADGTVFQFADCCTLASHCTGQNLRSIGIEVVDPGTPTSTEKPPREVLRERIHGVDVTHTGFYPAQTASTLALVRALCTHYGLPLMVPMDGDDVASGVLDDEALAAFTGVYGHLHANPAKRDPSLAILREVLKAAKP
jgi:N-acetyl-anhydromuramyl-L-alanine amidase AmpD